VSAVAVECKNVATRGQREPLRTVFLGGGTPSLLSGGQLKRLFGIITTYFEIAIDAEISVEVNPGTADKAKFEILQQCKVNRISIGVQSFNNKELRTIGRIHSEEEARQAIENARAAGFHNLSIDLMYALPGQTAKSWQQNLETALSMSVQHLSLYQLTVEEKTPLKVMIEGGKIQLPDEDTIAEMDAITDSLLEKSAFVQYEISNYARKGYQCLHNVNYWHNDDYYGIGAGAVSYSHGKRFKNIGIPERYCELLEAGQSVLAEKECLEREESFRETVIMGLRMNRGVSTKTLHERYGLDFETVYGKIVKKLCAQKLLEQRKTNFCLTPKGRCFANLVMAELV
jgi:oxygen-independent coproporphyrinogen-3 oxidase